MYAKSRVHVVYLSAIFKIAHQLSLSLPGSKSITQFHLCLYNLSLLTSTLPSCPDCIFPSMFWPSSSVSVYRHIVTTWMQSSSLRWRRVHGAKKVTSSNTFQLHFQRSVTHVCVFLSTDGVRQQIQFIDTAPWQEFPVMHRLYVSTCHLVVIVYDVTKKRWKESLTSMIKEVRQIKGE